MTKIQVGCVTMTWGKFKRANPDEWPEERILREVRQAGYEGVANGPKQGQSPQEFLDYLAGFELVPAPGYLGGNFWEADKREDQVNAARLKAKVSQSIGLSEIFVAPSGQDYVSRASGPSGGKTRRQLAGQVGPDDGLTDEEYDVMAETLNRMGRAMLEEGVKLCIHNHVAQVIETRQELDRLFSLVGPEAVFLGPDIGHLAFAGIDAAQFVRDYAPRIKALHLKDIDPQVRAQGVREAWDMPTFTGSGIYTELGQGCVDYPAIFQTLREANFSGWILSEIDVTQKPSALQSATECREFLHSQGI